MDLRACGSSVFSSTRLHFERQHALDSHEHVSVAAGCLAIERTEDSGCGLETVGELLDQRWEIRRTQLLLALRDDHEVHRRLSLNPNDRLERIQKRPLR